MGKTHRAAKTRVFLFKIKLPAKLKRPPKKNRLPRSFYDRPTNIVARELLGKALIRKVGTEWLGGLIVETEAYLSENDPACHASRGKTASNASMFQSPGTLYVYPIHAKHCMNAVTEAEGRGSAVLIRAIEPLWGIDIMKANRAHDDLRRLTRGPGMLCQALQIDRQLDGVSLIRGDEVFITPAKPHDDLRIVTTSRIGISKAKSEMLRYIVGGNRFVSQKIY